MIKPHIVVDRTGIVVIMPFNAHAKDALKEQIPFEQRSWNPIKKHWKLSLTEENYKIALSVLKEHFPAFKKTPLVFSKGGDVQAAFDVAIDTTSYYTILKIPSIATQNEIRKGHRKLVLKVHPDYGGDAEHFRMIQKAYEVLSNPKKRKRYDLSRKLLYGGKEDDWKGDPMANPANPLNQPPHTRPRRNPPSWKVSPSGFTPPWGSTGFGGTT